MRPGADSGVLARPIDTAASIPRRKPLTARIGVFGVGFHAYWPQFEGLLSELRGKLATFIKKVQQTGAEVVDFGIADDAESAYALLPRMQAADLDLVFCDMLTYATSATP
jgi:L-arabinose isomerase